MFEHRFVKFMDGVNPQKGYELWKVEIVGDSYKLIYKEMVDRFNMFSEIEEIFNKGVLIFALEGGEWVYKKTVER